MSKRKAVDFSALEDAVANPIKPVRDLEAKSQGKAPSRAGKVQIGVHVDPDTRTALKTLSIEQDKPLNALMLEGIELLRVKYGK